MNDWMRRQRAAALAARCAAASAAVSGAAAAASAGAGAAADAASSGLVAAWLGAAEGVMGLHPAISASSGVSERSRWRGSARLGTSGASLQLLQLALLPIRQGDPKGSAGMPAEGQRRWESMCGGGESQAARERLGLQERGSKLTNEQPAGGPLHRSRPLPEPNPKGALMTPAN